MPEHNKITNETFYKIFPTIRVRYSSNGFFVEVYQPRNHDWCLIKFYDSSNVSIGNAEELNALSTFISKLGMK